MASKYSVWDEACQNPLHKYDLDNEKKKKKKSFLPSYIIPTFVQYTFAT